MKVDTVSAAQERAQRREPAHGDQVTFRGDKCDRSRGEEFYFVVQLLLHENGLQALVRMSKEDTLDVFVDQTKDALYGILFCIALV